jgi:hypothetical protein
VWAVILLLVAVMMPQAALAEQQRRPVCHLTRQGGFILISVVSSEVARHLAHGDGLPGMNGLNGNCELDADFDGVPDARDNCVNTPNPDQSNRYGSPKGDACEDDSNGDGELDANESDICVSIDGVQIIVAGTSTCLSAPAPAGAPPNIAVAHGAGALAHANYGENNTATADGASTSSAIIGGSHNVAVTDGEPIDGEAALVLIQGGSFNTVMALGDGALAMVILGNFNTVTATGTYANAEAWFGDHNTITANGEDTYAVSDNGYNNIVGAYGDDATAMVFDGDNNIVTAHGACTVSILGESGVVASCP